MIIEGKEGEIKRSGGGLQQGREEREGEVARWPWRCFRNLIASTFAYLRAVVSICLCNGLPAGEFGNTSGAFVTAAWLVGSKPVETQTGQIGVVMIT